RSRRRWATAGCRATPRSWCSTPAPRRSTSRCCGASCRGCAEPRSTGTCSGPRDDGAEMKGIWRHLYFQVLVAIVAGGLLGWAAPALGQRLELLGLGFIALIKMLIAPVIFCTVVLGIANAGDMRRVGRVGVLALLYFEIVSTIALAIGLVVVNVL